MKCTAYGAMKYNAKQGIVWRGGTLLLTCISPSREEWSLTAFFSWPRPRGNWWKQNTSSDTLWRKQRYQQLTIAAAVNKPATQSTYYYYYYKSLQLGNCRLLARRTYDIVWAMAPATPPQSKLTWVFRIRTSGLSEEGRPSVSGKCFKPRLFRVPKVKNEKPSGFKNSSRQTVTLMHNKDQCLCLPTKLWSTIKNLHMGPFQLELA